MPESSPEEASAYPQALQQIIALFENLPEVEKRETLVAYSEQAGQFEPPAEHKFDLEDVRKDEECTDTVGVFLNVDEENHAQFCIHLGPKVQTLTKAMTSILCKGLNGATLDEIVRIPQDFVPKIVGGELVRIRSRTVYYVLGRMKSAASVLLSRQRLEAS